MPSVSPTNVPTAQNRQKGSVIIGYYEYDDYFVPSGSSKSKSKSKGKGRRKGAKGMMSKSKGDSTSESGRKMMRMMNRLFRTSNGTCLFEAVEHPVEKSSPIDKSFRLVRFSWQGSLSTS